jgi:hypothetical protein
MKINQITLNRLRNDANFQFHTEFKELAEKLGPEALKIRLQYDAYLPLYDKVDLALKKIAKSTITEQIQEAQGQGRGLEGACGDEYSLFEAFVVIEGSADYEPFIRKLNISIAKYNLLATQASRRPGKGKGKKEEAQGGSK